MLNAKKLTGLALATAAAGLFATAGISTATAADAKGDKVKCEGVNACKGKGACKTAKNDCAGKNACKGQSWTSTTKAECDAAKAKAKK